MAVEQLKFSRSINASPDMVYQMFTNAWGVREWLTDNAVCNAREGGSLHLWWNDGYYMFGEYTALEEGKRVSFTWYGSREKAASRVDVQLSESGDGTDLTLTHTDIPSEDAREEFKKGWEMGLENLQSVVEDGIDLRIARRPMLGIIVNRQVDEELAEELGLPVTEGVEIGPALEGMGAEAAGLQSGDVIVRLGDLPITTFQSFAPAVDKYQAGDEVEVDFYRNGELHTVQMTLSKRPTPDVSDNPEELAARVQELFEQIEDEIEEIVADISDEVASHHPADGEWNVKQVLAHLIISVRGTFHYLGTLIAGSEQINFAGNVQAQHDAIVAAHPTVDDLLAEFRRSHAEVVALIANLPDEFVARKRSYMRMGQGALQGAFHPQGHHDQLRNCIEAARSELESV